MAETIKIIALFLIFTLAFQTSMGYALRDSDDDYYAMALANLMRQKQNPNSEAEPNQAGLVDKRACIRRGGRCDRRPSDCCENSACRCNLFGNNCTCQRKSLFQKLM